MTRRRSLLFLAMALLLQGAVCLTSWPASAWVVRPVTPGAPAKFISELGGAIFVSTRDGIWRLATAGAEPELVARGWAWFVEERGGAIFVRTSEGVWRLATAGAEPELVLPVGAWFVEERGGAIFMGTADAVWRLATAWAEPDFVVPGHPGFVEERSGAVFVGTEQGVWRMATAAAEPELVVPGSALFVEERGGAIFVGTADAVWRLATAWAEPEIVVPGRAEFVEERGGAVFVGNRNGVWRLATAGAEPELVARGRAEFVAEWSGAILVATFNGVWRMATAAAEPELVTLGEGPFSRHRVLFVQEWGGAIIAATYEAVWRLATVGAEPELVAPGELRFFEERGGAILVGTDRGFWRLATAASEPELIAHGGARFVEERGRAIFVGTGEGVWRLATAVSEPNRVVSGRAEFVEERGGAIFVGTEQGVWRLAMAAVEPELVVPGRPLFVEERVGAIFVATAEAVWRLATAGAEPEFVVPGQAEFVEERGGAIFVGTEQGVWRLAMAAVEPELVFRGPASFVEAWDGLVFVGTSIDLFILFDARAVVTELRSGREAAWWEQALSWLVPNTVIGTPAIGEVSYEGPDAALITVPPHHFRVILDADPDNFDGRKRRGEFVSAELAQPVPVGFPTTVHIAIRDGWGNEHEHTLDQLVLPSAGTLGLLVVAIPPLLMLVALFGAPFSSFCHSTIMNPYLRRIGSFGVVPLVLTLVPPARRLVLKRYRRALLASVDIRGWEERFVTPEERFTARAFGERMREQRRLLIVGVSGVGKTAFLRHLTACLALGKVSLDRHAPLPVYLALGRYDAVASVEAMVKRQLDNLGGLTDDALADWLIRHDSFVFLFDGLNETANERRGQIVAFVDDHLHDNRNWVVAASQDPYADNFGHWGAVETMPRLTRSGIAEFLGRRLGEARATALVDSLEDAQHELLSLPQNLELALELAPDGEVLPQSEEALFRKLFEQQFAAWRENDNGDFVGIFVAQAYAMLRDRTPADLRNEIAGPLIKRKLMRRLGDAVYFRHDTLRGYAASLHFVDRWAELIEADGGRIDANWDAMLRLAAGQLFEQDPAGGQVQALLSALVGAAPQRAAILFSSLEQRHAEFARRFRGEFDRAFGEATRRQLAKAA